jgi:hypothetical protein
MTNHRLRGQRAPISRAASLARHRSPPLVIVVSTSLALMLGSCSAPPCALTVCGAECVDVHADARNCGACGIACAPGNLCVGGLCAPACRTGQTTCGTACVDTTNSPDHCGACDKAWQGWPCDAKLEELRNEFARSTDETAKKKIAENLQVRGFEIGTHAPVGEYVAPAAVRKGIKGLVIGPGDFYWGIRKD